MAEIIMAENLKLAQSAGAVPESASFWDPVSITNADVVTPASTEGGTGGKKTTNPTKRDLIDIYADILRAIGPGARKTRIVYRANLNFSLCTRYLSELLGVGLVEATTDPHPTWTVTEVGREFLEKHGELRGLLSRGRKRGAGTAKVRIELDPEAVEMLKDALERAEPVEKPAEEKRRRRVDNDGD